MSRKLALAFAFLSLPTVLHAQNDAAVEFDPARSRIEFTLSDVLHTVHGTFKMKSGAIRFDPDGNRVSGAVVVDTLSGDSGSHARDSRMHRDILESRTYPDMTFAPVSVEGAVVLQGRSQLQVTGVLTLHGTQHQLTLPMSVQVDGDQITVETRFVVPYVQWGLKNPSNFILRVSDKVDILVTAAGKVTFPQTVRSANSSR